MNKIAMNSGAHSLIQSDRLEMEISIPDIKFENAAWDSSSYF